MTSCISVRTAAEVRASDDCHCGDVLSWPKSIRAEKISAWPTIAEAEAEAEAEEEEEEEEGGRDRRGSLVSSAPHEDQGRSLANESRKEEITSAGKRERERVDMLLKQRTT